jgi:hypothetical protein
MKVRIVSSANFNFRTVLLLIGLFFSYNNTVSQTQTSTAERKIEIPFELKTAGYVTLVIEDKYGSRVRNIISDKWFESGKNKIFWDGLDDLGRDPLSANKGIYIVPNNPVASGDYVLKGLVHQEIALKYEFSVYASGHPSWPTNDHTGGWLANHTPPQAAVFVPAAQSPTKKPAVFLGAYITEGTDGLIWVDLDGNKIGGKKTIGNAWIAAPFIARDSNPTVQQDVFIYVASAWFTDKKNSIAAVQIIAVSPKKDKQVIKYEIGKIESDSSASEIGGLAVRNSIAVISLTKQNRLLIFNLKNGTEIGSVNIKSPTGLAFDSKGALYGISDNQIYVLKSISGIKLPSPTMVGKPNLDHPFGITLDNKDNIYVSTGGESNQVKVLNTSGKAMYSIGDPGPSAAGPYNFKHMNNPAGITIDSRQQLWVTENDFLPKRVSVWTLDGKFVNAFYGPQKYGGGGTLDGHDKTNFYYSEGSKGTMHFKLDWKTGSSILKDIPYRQDKSTLALASRNSAPETPICFNSKQYFTNCYNSNPTNGGNTAFLFAEKKGLIYPVAGMGRADDWPLLKKDEFKSIWPSGTNFNAKMWNCFFIWSDLNNDGQVQVKEVSLIKGVATGVTVMSDLTFCISRLNNQTVSFSPASYTAERVPVYDIKNQDILIVGVQQAASSGGNQALMASKSLTVVTLGALPFSPLSLSGATNGKVNWSYPSMWPGLHASHQAPVPSFSGELIGTTRLLGGLIENKGLTSENKLWVINSNHGMTYVFTADGMFVTTLFQPMRTGKRWNVPLTRGSNVRDFSLGEENFWPTITGTEGGEVYIVNGSSSSLVSVSGLNSIYRLPVKTIKVPFKDSKNISKTAFMPSPLKLNEQKTLEVPIRQSPFKVDGNLEDWKQAKWVDINQNTQATLAVSGDRLFVAYKTGNLSLLKNSGELPLSPFKTGGALDLMIRAGHPDDRVPNKLIKGDSRILVTLVDGKTYALIYRAIVSGVSDINKVLFSSPTRTVAFDKVENISAIVQLASGKTGVYEVSIPLSTINVKAVSGLKIMGDIGVLSGDGSETLGRSYWSNKSTTIVSDVPSEAELVPVNWGIWVFK